MWTTPSKPLTYKRKINERVTTATRSDTSRHSVKNDDRKAIKATIVDTDHRRHTIDHNKIMCVHNRITHTHDQTTTAHSFNNVHGNNTEEKAKLARDTAEHTPQVLMTDHKHTKAHIGIRPKPNGHTELARE